MNSARQMAFDLLNQNQEGRHPLDHWLDQAEEGLKELTRADRALVHALVYGCLRWQSRLDFIIDHLADKPGKIDPRARIILRLALFQLFHMDRIPAAAAVHSAVELAKNNRMQWAAGFINGLLRRAARGLPFPWPDISRSPESALAVNYAFPRWLVARWLARWGEEEVRYLCEAINEVPSITLRTNTLKTDRLELMAAIRQEAAQVHETAYAPEGISLAGLTRPFPQWPSFQEGMFQIQDEAAQLAVHMFGPRPGETVWDACAGLGTKTAHIAQLMDNRGCLIASDVNAFRLGRLSEEMTRLGITIASCRAVDLTAEDFPELPIFDRILLDAPCSGLGVLQKNPDGKWRVTPEDLKRYQQRQIAMLSHVTSHLRNGGILVYAVCTFEPEENEAVVKAFLQKHPNFAIHHPCMSVAADAQPALLTPEGWLRTLPHRHRMDGFFAAAFIKKD